MNHTDTMKLALDALTSLFSMKAEPDRADRIGAAIAALQAAIDAPSEPVAQRLKVDPNSGGSAPIIAAIDELKNANAALVSALDRIKDVLNGAYVDDVALIVNKALKQNRKAMK